MTTSEPAPPLRSRRKQPSAFRAVAPVVTDHIDTADLALVDACAAERKFRLAEQERREAICAAIASGCTYRQVAEAIGVTHATVHYHVNGHRQRAAGGAS